MAQRHHDLTDSTAGTVTTADALAGYLRGQATEFLRALRLHRETGGASSNGSAAVSAGAAGGAASSAEVRVDAARALRRSARRISGSLHTFRPLLEPEWAEGIRPELAWLSGTLALEHAYGSRLERLLLALNRLSGAAPHPMPTQLIGTASTPATAGMPGTAGTAGTAGTPGTAGTGDRATVHPTSPDRASVHPGRATAHPATPDRGNLTVGAAKAGALLDRQLTLARTRAHSTALQALGSSRFHAVADKVAVLASEVPLTSAASATDLRPLATAAEERLADAVTALPLVTAGSPYNAAALIHGLSPDPAPHPQDAPWHQVRLLLRLHRYACEVVHGRNTPFDVRLLTASEALDRHRDASEASSAAAQAARTPRIAPATAYALGVLHADQRHEVEAARYAFQRSWQKQTIGAP